MTAEPADPLLCASLARFDTPSVANAVEAFNARELTEGYASTDIRCLTRGEQPMVGYAVTVTFDSTTGGRAHPSRWFELMDLLKTAPMPAVVVSQYVGSDVRRGCWLGDIVATMFRRLGVVGTVTDTAIRDVRTITERLPDFSVFALGSVASHGNGVLVDLDVPVTIGGMRVRPGDLLHGDANGLITIPRAIADQVPEQAARVQETESGLVALMGREPIDFDTVRERFSH